MGLRTDDVLRVAHGAPAAVKGALTEGFQSAFLTGAGLAVLGIVLAVTLIRSRDSRAHAAAESEQVAEAPA